MTGTKPGLYVCVLVNLLALTLLAVHVLVGVWLVSLIKDKRRGMGRQQQTNITLPVWGDLQFVCAGPMVCLWCAQKIPVCSSTG